MLCSSSHADWKYNSGTRIELAIKLQEPWQTQMWWTQQESNKWRVEVCNHKTWATPEPSTYLNRQCKHIAKATRQSSNTHNQNSPDLYKEVNSRILHWWIVKYLSPSCGRQCTEEQILRIWSMYINLFSVLLIAFKKIQYPSKNHSRCIQGKNPGLSP